MPEYDALENLDKAIRDRINEDEDGYEANTDEQLAAAFSSLRRSTAKQGAKIDVAAQVTAQIRERRGILIRMGRWMPATAAAAVILFFTQNVLWAKSIGISAPGGAQLWIDQGWVSVHGELKVDAPVRLKSKHYPVAITGPSWSGQVDSDSIVGVTDTQSLDLESGKIRITSEKSVRLHVGHKHALIQGAIHVGRQGGSTMTNAGKLSAASSGAMAVVAIYSGFATFSDEETSTRIDAPAGAVVDSEGNVTRTGLEDAEDQLANSSSKREELRRLIRQTQAAAEPDESEKKPTGGFWDDEGQTVRFSLAGEVFDAQTGTAIKDFDVDLAAVSSRSFDAPGDHSIHVTDAQDGKFRLTGLGLGEWSLRVRAEGYAPTQQQITLSGITSNPYVVVPLSQGGQITGTVTDSRGQELDDVTVRLGECTDRGRVNCPQVKTDAKGNFVLTGAPEERSFSIRAHHPRFGFADHRDLRLAEAETQHINLQLSGILKVTGTVYRGEDQEPVAGMEVRAKDQSTRTDESGYYEILTPLEDQPGTSVYVAPTGTEQPQNHYSFAGYGGFLQGNFQWVDAETHVAEMQMDFHLDESNAVLTGQITNSDGTPAAAVNVAIRRRRSVTAPGIGLQALPGPTVTDPNGNYRIEGIPAKSSYAVNVVEDGRDRPLGAVTIDKPRKVVANFTIGGGAIRGRFVDSETGVDFPIGDSCSSFGARSQNDDTFYPASYLDDATFELRDIPKGTYRLGYIDTDAASNQFEFEEQVVELTDNILDGLIVRVRGDKPEMWSTRIINESAGFISGVLVRYPMSKDVWQGILLKPDNKGVSEFSVPTKKTQIVFDAPGYESVALDLTDLDPDSTIDVTMKRVEE